MNEQAVGIDVSKQKLDVCHTQGDRGKHKIFENTQQGHQALLRWLDRRLEGERVPVCLEATGAYSEVVATALFEANWPVSVVNPARVKGFAQSEMSRNKTDEVDTRLLARFAQRAELELWQPPSPALRRLRLLVERLEALQAMRQQEKNRLEALSAGTDGQPVDAMVREHIDWLEEQIRRLESEIDDHIDGHPELKEDAELLISIPGLGRRSIAQLLAYLGDVRRFRSAKALAAFVGVSPRQRRSGTSLNGRTVLARTGHTAARKALYMPGLVAVRHNPVNAALAARLRARGLAPKAIVGASMRKLVHLIYGVIQSRKPFQADIAMPDLAKEDGI